MESSELAIWFCTSKSCIRARHSNGFSPCFPIAVSSWQHKLASRLASWHWDTVRPCLRALSAVVLMAIRGVLLQQAATDVSSYLLINYLRVTGTSILQAVSLFTPSIFRGGRGPGYLPLPNTSISGGHHLAVCTQNVEMHSIMDEKMVKGEIWYNMVSRSAKFTILNQAQCTVPLCVDSRSNSTQALGVGQ